MALSTPQGYLNLSKLLRSRAASLSGPQKKKAIALANTALALAKLRLQYRKVVPHERDGSGPEDHPETLPRLPGAFKEPLLTHTQTYGYSYKPGHQWKWESQPPPPGTGQRQGATKAKWESQPPPPRTGQGQGATKPKPEGNARKTTRTTQHRAQPRWPNLSLPEIIALTMAAAFFAGIIIAFPWAHFAVASDTPVGTPGLTKSALKPAADEYISFEDAMKLGPSRAVPSYRWSPNGEPWPSRAGYLPGHKILAGGGLSKLTVDNTKGGSNVHVKLCHPSQGPCDGLRHVYIPDGASFSMLKLSPGVYEIRYRDLSTGAISKSEPILVKEEDVGNRTRFSAISLTLYRVTGGNTHFTSLREDQF